MMYMKQRWEAGPFHLDLMLTGAANTALPREGWDALGDLVAHVEAFVAQLAALYPERPA